MTFIEVPNTVKSVVRFIQSGRVYTNNIYWYNTEGWDMALMEELGSRIVERWSLNIAPEVSNAVELQDVLVYDMESESAPIVTYTPPTAHVGDVASPVLPGNVTLAISLRTANRGKSGRGRLYHIGLYEDGVIGNTVQGSVVTGLQTGYDNFFTQISTLVGCVGVVVSFYHNHAPRLQGLAQVINSITVDATVDTQRRRVKP
jgi:hypothetical protein